MGSLEEDLERAVQRWSHKGEYLENEDGVKIDIEDFFWVRFRKVSIDTYAQIGIGSGQYRLHCLICPNYGPGFIDHENRDKLDNRRKNLRITTIQQSNINRPYLRDKTSTYRGVSLWNSKGHTYWRASICFNRKYITLGVRKTELEAAILYNQKAPEYHGEFAQLNILP